jgi:hypothetical protein
MPPPHLAVPEVCSDPPGPAGQVPAAPQGQAAVRVSAGRKVRHVTCSGKKLDSQMCPENDDARVKPVQHSQADSVYVCAESVCLSNQHFLCPCVPTAPSHPSAPTGPVPVSAAVMRARASSGADLGCDWPDRKG